MNDVWTHEPEKKMEIDNATIIVAIIGVALFAVPFVLDWRRRTKNAARLIGVVREAARLQHCKIRRHAVCGGTVLGLDTEKNMVFFFASWEDAATVQHVDLTRMRACEAVKSGRTAKGTNSDARLDRVELRFLPREKDAGETRWVLYRERLGVHVDGEAQLADEWAQLINARLNGK